MSEFLTCISNTVSEAFASAGYDASYGRVSLSNRPDLCEFQCNGALAAAKAYHKAPIAIAEEVAAKLAESGVFEKAEAVRPGFLNFTVSPAFAADYLAQMAADGRLGAPTVTQNGPTIVDFGGANAAKPLHVGHLRSAVIGESVKRLSRFMGVETIGDVHLGDWGLQMGLIIEELRDRKPDLPYFDDSFTGEYPAEAPFTISELEEIYPAASAKSKTDEAFLSRAHEATRKLQEGDPACRAIWHHIIRVSKTDLKKNYDSLNVTFDLWKGESDAQPYIPDMLADLASRGISHESQGAMVVDVQEESDTKEVPPCIVQKSDGAALYATSDLATILEREKLYAPARYIYVVDKRQEMHFTQVFRTARKAGYVKPETRLDFLGFGTMNGKDGKPFKTRQGGVMRLENLIAEITDAVREKTAENATEGAEENASVIALAALKYGDLQNAAAKDYVFDVDRFSSFEGNTGPYLLYTIVRIKSILRKYAEQGGVVNPEALLPASTAAEKSLQLLTARFPETVKSAYDELAVHKLCGYVYDLANAFNSFYHETKILAEPDETLRAGRLALITLVCRVCETVIDILGFEAPEKM